MFFDDNPANAVTQRAREKYIDGCLQAFIDRVPLDLPYNTYIAKAINTLYWNNCIPAIKEKMAGQKDRIDCHKIISGTQCAIMQGCVLRTKETLHIPYKTYESKDNPQIRKVNAIFALFMAYDILEQWNNIDLTPIRNRNLFCREHVALLKDVAIHFNSGRTTFPLFAISQLWYLAEELCKAESVAPSSPAND